MAENIRICDLDPALKEKLKKFRFRKETNNAVIIMKIEKEKRLVVLDEEYNDYSIDEVREELSENQPRFLVYSYGYEHGDGRKSYPLCFIFFSPEGCSPEQHMIYTGSLKGLVDEIGVSKVFDIRNLEDMTEEWLKEKLQFYR